jgi:hypothetical protein
MLLTVVRSPLLMLTARSSARLPPGIRRGFALDNANPASDASPCLQSATRFRK